MFRAVILPLANQDIKETAFWYNSKQKGLGKRFVQELRSKVLYICKDPLTIAVRYDEVRCVMLDSFPYMIRFTMDSHQKMIIIAGVFHTALDPERWKKR